ncbi:TetR/AcrR family transcriptional regulator [Spongiactinospora rosea]|uniref:TetR/AcrR family transcriptional regulator n=1 Tax=Spongiactinospora rosea TaxID=2248750 RepID=A0A366M0L0_9ACTN|nr:TetR/AcrR family transcriptional regulator [Spongiactinospora rosea]RBQ19323.1 TetR/AcrR family transcriptional regulator [Spongiactinospora rosea]
MRESSDTRHRIEQVALTLFNEKGYEATSLREIAEKLGVTKAALYYHFKSKDEIVAGLAETRLARLRGLLDWARSQPATLETRREVVRRYAADLHDLRYSDVMRFFERNQTALRDHPVTHKNRDTMIELSKVLHSPGEPLATRLKRTMALFSLHAGHVFQMAEAGDPEEYRQAALEVALELVSD